MPIILRDVPNAKLVILGKGEQEDMIKHMISNLGISKSVVTRFEFVNEEERLLNYAACDVAVFPSKYEPFGIVCTEAMSMGKPVVVGARGTSGFKEQIVPAGPDRCGSHVNPYDPHDIAKFTIELLKDKDLRMRAGKNARKRVLENYTIEKMAAETLNIYKEVAGITD
jgi:glycosyltransferase involved in cell wall biosynthesis